MSNDAKPEPPEGDGINVVPPRAAAPDETGTAADDVTDPTAPPDTVAVDLAAERDEYRDLLLRKTAEFDNYRKRIERERAERARAAAADLLEELLPLVDDLERALEAPADGKQAAAYRAGVELIHRQLLEVLRKRDVAPIETAGAEFDPNLHQAVVSEPSETHRDGEIIDELRRGYTLGGRLLRPSMVRVAKA